MDLTPEERERIYLEEKAKREAPPPVQPQEQPTEPPPTEKRMSMIPVIVLLIVLGSVLFVAVMGSNTANYTSSTTTQSTVAPTGNIAHDRLVSLAAESQASLLGMIVSSSGYSCTGELAFFMGIDQKDNTALWSVRCTNGRRYQVSINADATGSTNVLDCDILEAVGNVQCFLKLEYQRATPSRTRGAR